MAYVIVRHKVEDFGRWKADYDEHLPAREAAGLKEVHLWRNVDDRNDLVLVFEAADVDRARDFARSEDLKKRMAEIGVIGPPQIVIVTDH